MHDRVKIASDGILCRNPKKTLVFFWVLGLVLILVIVNWGSQRRFEGEKKVFKWTSDSRIPDKSWITWKLETESKQPQKMEHKKPKITAASNYVIMRGKMLSWVNTRVLATVSQIIIFTIQDQEEAMSVLCPSLTQSTTAASSECFCHHDKLAVLLGAKQAGWKETARFESAVQLTTSSDTQLAVWSCFLTVRPQLEPSTQRTVKISVSSGCFNSVFLYLVHFLHFFIYFCHSTKRKLCHYTGLYNKYFSPGL